MATDMIAADQDIGNGNGNGLARRGPNAATSALMTREAQEVQAAMYVAQQFPRDEIESERRIMQACKRRSLAGEAMYAYPRGNETVTGPSIRLAEVLAQNWGNIDVGIKELSQKNGESEVMAFAWDLETNYRQVKIFTVKHERHTRQGVKKLTDPRDVYELVANQGARRLRACILGVIPGDIVDKAVSECEKTLKGNNAEPLADRAKKMLAAFEDKGVTRAQLEKRLGHNIDAILEVELLQLGKIYNAIRDGHAAIDTYFPPDSTPKPTSEKTDREKELLGDEPKGEAPKKEAEKKPAENPDADPIPADEMAQEMIERCRKLPDDKVKAFGEEMASKKNYLGDHYAEVLATYQERFRALPAKKTK